MNKAQFFNVLKQALAALPAEELDDVLADYHEYFRDGVANGRTEEEVAKGLGSPRKIARELLAQQRIQEWKDHKSMNNLLRVAVSIAALGSLNLFLAFPMLVFMFLLTLSYIGSMGMIAVGLLCGLLLIPDVAKELDWSGTAMVEDGHFNTADGARQNQTSATQYSQTMRRAYHDANGRQIVEYWRNGELLRRETIETNGQLKVEGTLRDEMTGDDKAHVRIERDTFGNERIRITGGEGEKVAIDRRIDQQASSLRIDDGESTVHIKGINGLNTTQVKWVGLLLGLVCGSVWLCLNIWLTRSLIRGCVKYAKLNMSIIRGEALANGSPAI
ncbi:DUF1700 domain-containing protein [Chitinivorax sp. B]|uniref:DUF1700 domain-containing protein n=1 Tax=Chitinivorax sp. B TaxID=2502235 RepID=UPI0010F5FCE8|nr:DUF1700 domain-containing protein [Chitinivorax sp. B]